MKKCVVIVIAAAALVIAMPAAAGAGEEAGGQSVEVAQADTANQQRPATLTEAMASDEIGDTKEGKSKKLAFGISAIIENAGGVDIPRPTYFLSFNVNPALKIGKNLALTARFYLQYEGYQRMLNGMHWVFDDIIIEFSDKALYSVETKNKKYGFNLGGALRYYIPVSLYSRQAGSFGQFRAILKPSVTLSIVTLGADLNAQVYMNRYISWDTYENPDDPVWMINAGLEDYIENNTAYGFGENFYVDVNPFAGFDIYVSYALMQSRRYSIRDNGDPDWLDPVANKPLPGATFWGFSYRFLAEISYELSGIKAIKNNKKLEPLGGLSFGVGWVCFAPFYRGEVRGNVYNPFDPNYGQVYGDVRFSY